MGEAPVELVESLASKEEQVRWITNATPEEYLLPEEMLNDGIRFCEWVLTSDIPTTAMQRDATRCNAIIIGRD